MIKCRLSAWYRYKNKHAAEECVPAEQVYWNQHKTGSRQFYSGCKICYKSLLRCSLDFCSSSIGAEIVSYSFKEPNLVFQGLQLIEKTSRKSSRKKRQNMSVVTAASWALILHWEPDYWVTLTQQQTLGDDTLAHAEYQPKHHFCKQLSFQVSENFSQTTADLVFRSQTEFRRKIGGTVQRRFIKDFLSWNGLLKRKFNSKRLQFCLPGPLASLLLLIFQIHFLCKWVRVI